MNETFVIEKPDFDSAAARATFRYRLNDLTFTEILDFGMAVAPERFQSPALHKLMDLTALVLGVSYFKLRAPLSIAAPAIALTMDEKAFITDVYENGLAEFYARNDLKRFGRLTFEMPEDTAKPETPDLPRKSLVPIGGGKDSLVSVQLLERMGEDFIPFAVNPKGPILGGFEVIGKPPLTVRRTLDAEMIRLGSEPGFYNGHVPSTAIISMIAAMSALLFGFDRIILSNERSASEGNAAYDGREANHQHSKSLDFERLIAGVLSAATSGALQYFSLLRPFSEARIAGLFARETRFDRVFSSCNRNFRLSGHDGTLWCGECPKCHFTFLIMAPVMDKARVLDIFGRNFLADSANESSYRELTGLAGQKPWECVGEILEAAACLWQLSAHPDWQDDALVATLRPDLERQYGANALEAAAKELTMDSGAHMIPDELMTRVKSDAL